MATDLRMLNEHVNTSVIRVHVGFTDKIRVDLRRKGNQEIVYTFLAWLAKTGQLNVYTGKQHSSQTWDQQMAIV